MSSMVFQWFYHPWTITIEMFFCRSTIEIDGFLMVFPNSDAMVSNGLTLNKLAKPRRHTSRVHLAKIHFGLYTLDKTLWNEHLSLHKHFPAFRGLYTFFRSIYVINTFSSISTFQNHFWIEAFVYIFVKH